MGPFLRLLILTQYFPPETGAPQARLSESAVRLRERGVEIQILTAMPSYPLGRVFDGWRGRWFMRDEWNGFPIVRSFVYPTKSPRALPRLLSYFSFVASSFLAGVFMVDRFDVILVESPPLFLGISGVALKLLRRARMVLNISDLWPESVVALGLYRRESVLVRLAAALEKQLYRVSHTVTGQSAGIVRGVLEVEPAARVVLVPGGVDCIVFSPERRDPGQLARFTTGGKLCVGYAGLIGIAQGIGLLLEVAARLQGRDDIVFLIAGDGPEREELQSRAGPNVVFTGLLPKSDMPVLVASFDVTVIPLMSPIPGALPSKMYEAMACAVPIVLVAEGDPRELLERAGCGLHAAYGDIESVANAVTRLCDERELARELGHRGRDYVVQHHRRDVIADRMLEVLTTAAKAVRS